MHELGGDVIVPPQDGPLGARETVADVARNLERWVACAVVRTFGQDAVVAFAEAAPRLHVINALTNEEHPCQAAADLLTLHERWGGLGRAARGRTIAYVGDGNNVATSLVHAAMLSGVSRPRRDAEGRRAAGRGAWPRAERASQHGATLTAARGSGQGGQRRRRRLHRRLDVDGPGERSGDAAVAFRPYQVNAALMAHAGPTPCSCTACRRIAATKSPTR